MQRALHLRDVAATIGESTQGFKIAAALGDDGDAARAAEAASVALPRVPEAMALLSTADGLLAWGYDERGLVYALSELADRVRHAESDLFGPAPPLVEQPSARIRSIARLFCSEAEDKSWFHDRQFWHDYLSMLAATASTASR